MDGEINRAGLPHPLAASGEIQEAPSWWNPPWPYHWHRTYHQAQTCHHTGQPYPPRTTTWIQTQHRNWPRLHPQQQHLLTTIDIHPG